MRYIRTLLVGKLSMLCYLLVCVVSELGFFMGWLRRALLSLVLIVQTAACLSVGLCARNCVRSCASFVAEARSITSAQSERATAASPRQDPEDSPVVLIAISKNSY